MHPAADILLIDAAAATVRLCRLVRKRELGNKHKHLHKIQVPDQALGSGLPIANVTLFADFPAGTTAFPARLASPGIHEITCQMGWNSNTLCRESNLMEHAMVLSIQLDPILEAQIVQEAKRLGMSEADFVKDILERALGFKNPYQLLQQVRSGAPIGDPHASEHTGEKFKAKLHAQRTP